jgi:poly(glycerol-phosphate) alpha-glucosyltransferase
VHGSSASYDPNRFVLVARIHRKKRVDEAIRAFRLVVDRNPQARLEIYGFGYGDPLEKQIHELVGQLSLSGNVTFVGFVSDVGAIYRGACASIQTSQSEGFGMALLESLAHGVPVVAYDVEYGAREVIRDGVDGFVVAWGDRDQLAARIVQLSQDTDLRQRLSAAGPDGATRFSLESYAAKWSTLFEELPRRIDARILSGTLEVDGEVADSIVVRPRAGGPDEAAPVIDGRASLTLPHAVAGTLFDVYGGDGEELRRTRCRAGVPSDDPRWRAFITEFGNLTLQVLSDSEAAVTASRSAPAPEGKPVIPRTRLRLGRRLVARIRGGGVFR